MTSSKTNGNYDEVMESVNKALPTKAANNLVDGLKSLSGVILDPQKPSASKLMEPSLENIAPTIYACISDILDHVKNMLNGEKAAEYGDPLDMCKNISKRWFGCDDAETEVAIMMAELKIERIKYDRCKEDSYLDAIAYLTMALAFRQYGGKND